MEKYEKQIKHFGKSKISFSKNTFGMWSRNVYIYQQRNLYKKNAVVNFFHGLQACLRAFGIYITNCTWSKKKTMHIFGEKYTFCGKVFCKLGKLNMFRLYWKIRGIKLNQIFQSWRWHLPLKVKYNHNTFITTVGFGCTWHRLVDHAKILKRILLFLGKKLLKLMMLERAPKPMPETFALECSPQSGT